MNTTANTTARIPAVSVETDVAKGVLTLAFADKSTATLAIAELSKEILDQALMHGLKQKLVDAAAIARNTETGASATVADKKEAVLEVLTRLQSGAWNKGREGGDGSAKGSLLFLALTRLQPDRDSEELQTWVKARTDAERKSLEQNPKILPVIQAIQAERAAAKAAKSGVDSDALLDSLLG